MEISNTTLNDNINTKLALAIIRRAPWLTPVAFPLAGLINVTVGFLAIALPVYFIYSARADEEPLDYDKIYHEWLEVNYQTFDLGYLHLLAGDKVSFNGLDQFLNKGLFVKCMQILSIKQFNHDTIIVDGAVRFGQPKVMVTSFSYDGVTLPIQSYFKYTGGKKRLEHKITRFKTALDSSGGPVFPDMAKSASLAVNTNGSLPMQYGNDCDSNRYEMAEGQSANFVMATYDEARNSQGPQSFYRPGYKTFAEKQTARAERDKASNNTSFGDLFMFFMKKRFN